MRRNIGGHWLPSRGLDEDHRGMRARILRRAVRTTCPIAGLSRGTGAPFRLLAAAGAPAVRVDGTGASPVRRAGAMITDLGGRLAVLDVVHGGVHTLTLRGDLDIASFPELESATRHLTENGARAITLDLRELEFMDLAGLREILEVHERSEKEGYVLSLIPGPWQIQSLFERTGLLKILPFSDAAAAVAPPAEAPS
jgi:anti-anti-sigma factor